MQQPLNSPTCSMFCTWMFLLGSWPAHKAAPLPFPALSMVERGPAAAGKALVGSLLRDNTASRWFPHSFSPDAFKSYSWVWAEIHRVWKAECTRESTLLFFVYQKTLLHPYVQLQDVFFSDFFHRFILLQLQKLRLRPKNTLFASYSALARLFRKMHRVLYSLSQTWVQSNFFCSVLSNLIASNFSSFCRNDLMSISFNLIACISFFVLPVTFQEHPGPLDLSARRLQNHSDLREMTSFSKAESHC